MSTDRDTATTHIRRYLDDEISAGKLCKLVGDKRDIIGGFANIIDEDRRNASRMRYAVEQTLTAIGDLDSMVSQLKSALQVIAPERNTKDVCPRCGHSTDSCDCEPATQGKVW